jgi:H+-transporting ATPase
MDLGSGEEVQSPLISSNQGASDEEKKEDLNRASQFSEGDVTGLTNEEAAAMFAIHGRNEIPEEVTPLWVMFLKQFYGVMPFMLELSCLVSLILTQWTTFILILLMLLVNACIGFREESHAQASLDGLKSQLTQVVSTIRDGKPVALEVALLVPGDVIALRGGQAVPADCVWVEGDIIKVDTAPLTGEPLPWSVPRADKHGEPGSGKVMWAGMTVVQGEAFCKVTHTGLKTEIGKAAELVMANSGVQQGYFEKRIMQVVQGVIFLTIATTVVVFCVSVFVRNEKVSDTLVMCLSLIIGAVPIALPLVIQVTMAIGAATMAEHKAIITHITALQEIASMTVLNSDKTGTLTTAKMAVIKSKIWTRGGFTQDQALLWAALASNDANLDDPIDKSVLDAFKREYPDWQQQVAPYNRKKFVGFNALVKRAVAYFQHEKTGELKVAKGLVDKVLKTGDDGGDTWTVEDYDTIRKEVKDADLNLSSAGYKAIAVAVSFQGGPMQFVGIIPMLDPPRHDTKITIERVRKAGINVKMITGDHLNIAKETARLIDLGVNIYANTSLWPASAARDQLIVESDGFAQVMPVDKQEVVCVLQNKGLVVGMTGDGVNDAPALSQAQVGIAVDGATDAAKNAADIVLTEPGLSAIYSAVVESRKIFQRLRAYVLYRLAATIQIVVVLCVLIFVERTFLKSIYVILLALFNDISMTPIASDNARPSLKPDVPTLGGLLFMSVWLGAILTVQTLLFYYTATDSYIGISATGPRSWAKDDDPSTDDEAAGYDYRQCCLWLQISIAVEFLVLSCRTKGLCFTSQPASPTLICAVFGANIICSIMAVWKNDLTAPQPLAWDDVGRIWLYNLVWFVVTDLLKLLALWGLDDLESGSLEDAVNVDESMVAVDVASPSDPSRSSGAAHLIRQSNIRASATAGRISNLRGSAAFDPRESSMSQRGSVRPSMSTTLRPSNPANIAQILAAQNGGAAFGASRTAAQNALTDI